MALSQRFAALGGTIVLSVALAACGGDDTSTPSTTMPDETTSATTEPTTTEPTTTEPTTTESGTGSEVSEENNEADVDFAQQMIPHHRQAIEMSELAADRAGSDQVRGLAEQISAAQGPEIETMTTFLETWGAEVPEEMSMGDMDMGDMAGMMSPEQMEELGAAEGTEFDRMFLEMMIAHHEGATEMAMTEQAEGENPQAIELAEEIEAAQTEEIAQMQELLQSL